MQHWQPPQHSRDGPPFGGFPCSAALGRNVRSSTKKIAMYGLIVVLTTLALCSIVCAGELTGPAKVISTDTLEIHGTRVRLWGIDAPDKSQMCRDINLNPYRCGLMAASDLEAFIAEREVSCLSVLEDECGRTLAICSADGIDLGEWLVRNGLVLELGAILQAPIPRCATRGRSCRTGLVGGQLCRTLAISSVHSVRWWTSQLF
ncbi:endonuclease YncB(thermonuclease family) [Bradyrhizobium sp. GM22.5]